MAAVLWWNTHRQKCNTILTDNPFPTDCVPFAWINNGWIREPLFQWGQQQQLPKDSLQSNEWSLKWSPYSERVIQFPPKEWPAIVHCPKTQVRKMAEEEHEPILKQGGTVKAAEAFYQHYVIPDIHCTNKYCAQVIYDLRAQSVRLDIYCIITGRRRIGPNTIFLFLTREYTKNNRKYQKIQQTL